MIRKNLFILLITTLSIFLSCGRGEDSKSIQKEINLFITSDSGKEYNISYDSFVDTYPGASDDNVKDLIRKQIKSSLGALKPEFPLSL